MSNFCKMVLLIDDNYIDNILNTKILELTNFADRIISIQDTSEALEYLKLEYDLNKKVPDYIFLDIRMPIIDGFAFLDAFEDFNEGLKNKTQIIMLTSSLAREDESRALLNKHVKCFLKKPLAFDAVESLKVQFA
jgi:CheY-like chemotaxis protein